MNYKLIAMGNVLMRDDGIAVFLIKKIENELREMGIEIIIGETDIDYCLEAITDKDYLILMDASYFGKDPGEISLYKLNEIPINRKDYTQHSINLLDLLGLYHPVVDGILIAIEIAEVDYGYGLSSVLNNKFIQLTKNILILIEKLNMNLAIDIEEKVGETFG